MAIKKKKATASIIGFGAEQKLEAKRSLRRLVTGSWEDNAEIVIRGRRNVDMHYTVLESLTKLPMSARLVSPYVWSMCVITHLFQ